MNSSNEKKSNFGQTALRVAACIVLLNAALSGCADSPGSKQAAIVAESEIYEEITVVGPVAAPRRVRIRKRIRQAAGISQVTVLCARAIHVDSINRLESNTASLASFALGAFLQDG